MIRLIHRSQSIHELLLDGVCRQAGLYADAGIDVISEDGRGRSWERASAAPAAATVAAGGVVAEWLRGDADWRLRFVATTRPLMWVVGRDPLSSVDDLVGLRIATPPVTDMPSVFLGLILERHGYDIERDVIAVQVDRRPERERLLESGEVDASLLGPEGLMVDGAGFVPAIYIGEHIEYPTVGLAARSGLDDGQASALAAAFAAAVDRMHTDPDVGVRAMRDIDPQVSEVVAERIVHEVIVPHWRGAEWARSGRLGDVPAVAERLGVPLPPMEDTAAFLHGWASITGEAQ